MAIPSPAAVELIPLGRTMVGARAKAHDPITLRPSTTKAAGTGKKSILFSVEEQKAIQEARKVSDYGDKIVSGSKGKMTMKPKLATKTKLKKPVTTNKPKVASVFDEGNQIAGKKVSSIGGSGKTSRLFRGRFSKI